MNELDEVIFCVLQGLGSDQDEERISAWRRESADHERRYQAVAGVWSLTGLVAPDRGEPVPSPHELLRIARIREADPQTALSPARDAVVVSQSPVVSSSGTRRRLLAGHAWAAGLIAAGTAALGIGLGIYGIKSDSLLAEGAIATGPGEMTTITLSDASSIRLAPDSRLRLSESRNLRIAWLDGRAFFGIHPDRDRPFVVYTEHGEARVIGTRFEVNATNDEFTVLVVEGSVEVTAGGAGVDVVAGEMTRSEGGAQPVATPVTDVYERLDWIGNAVVFQATPMRDAVREIEQRFQVDVELIDKELEDLLVTAAFTGESVPQVVRVVCEVINAVCEFDGLVVRIDSPSP